MNFPTSVKSGFSNYANFKGRASRSEFWWFVLFSQLIQTVAQQVSGSTATIAWFALLIPGLSVHVRRLHDSGRSLRWFLWLAASMAGAALAFVGLLMQSAQTIANLDAEQLFDNGSILDIRNVYFLDFFSNRFGREFCFPLDAIRRRNEQVRTSASTNSLEVFRYSPLIHL